MAVVVDVGAHDSDRVEHGARFLGQDNAPATVIHFLLWLDGDCVYGLGSDAGQLTRCQVHKGAHAPRAVTRLPLSIADERVAETVHRHHFIDGGGHRQLLLVVRHTHDLDLTSGQQLGHIVVGKELLGARFTVDPHLGTILHHLQRRIEFETALAVAGARSDLIIKCVHESYCCFW